MKEIAAAFVKAQKAFGPALKTKSNPHLKSKYADLASVVEAVIDGLNNNGISMIQQLSECSDGVICETVFLHESGEIFTCGRFHVPASKQDAQGYGSALTYARRYSLMAACGIAPEDDDGNAATKKTGMPASELADWIAEIQACSTQDSLKDVYLKAYKAAGTDSSAQKAIISAKDAMKGKV